MKAILYWSIMIYSNATLTKILIKLKTYLYCVYNMVLFVVTIGIHYWYFKNDRKLNKILESPD